ncbi:MAG: T9SS type A sorting domain-containing protein [Bacteroidetes bacterium]|nr:T9SS type A sorting domain-containing protein [Bacteroidota bacterium]
MTLSLNAYSQDRNSTWCFGDSSGIDFSSGSPVLFTSGVKSRGSCISMSDSLGHLLFSSYTRATIPGNTTLVKNRDGIVMPNGGNVVGGGWYQELVAIPMPNDTNQYYLFTVGVTNSFGLYYSIIDMRLDSGRGAVSQKNIQLQNYQADDCVMAIKHGNGRDWWILSRRWDTSNNDFYQYLISSSGISNVIIQNVGTPSINGFYHFTFSKDGTKMVATTAAGLIELFYFDRCTGIIMYDQTIIQEATSNYPFYFFSEFSPSGRYLYISSQTDGTVSYLLQFDLQAPDIFNSADTLWTYATTTYAIGAVKLASDDKIYVASCWYDGINFPYPYPDTIFNTVNNNLSVINYPDSPGVACGFTPFSFNLGAGRCYWGLPNNPDYELGAVVNSMCDTVTGVQSNKYEVSRQELHVFYHPGWQIAFINAEGLTGKKFNLQVFDLFGRVIYHDEGSLNSEYYTKDLNCDGFAKGMYIVTLQTGPVGQGEKLVKRFIKQ